ncbi:hypothetical protein HA052_04645 [Chromobacterium haemolyticum]|uniref:Abortive infection protein-like C-terminal domain-containing protein n=1 Tax=Chromobacterium fluminis TaxID=3044269 RepID=A0ABX0KY60_9NEIS|nr:hypothetical protein [Chromobacterium haemolyticum]NHR04479.1 hypothetical protein [Chromobacterium haemolyticum]
MNQPSRICSDAWGAIRDGLECLTFHQIKATAALAGMDTSKLADVDERPGKDGKPVRPAKGVLMAAVDQVLAQMPDDKQRRFMCLTAEETLRHKPDLLPKLESDLARLGWQWIDNTLLPIELFDPADLAALPEGFHADLVKAGQRFRDGDLGGAISAACGAVDTVTASIYHSAGLGDPTADSFQQRCNRALDAHKVIEHIDTQLRELGWEEAGLKPLRENFKGALNQGAYVMQSLRSKMGDVHGTKPILKPLVYDALKWAELFVHTLARGG